MLTSDEAEVYDRQIRLWGVSAQSRIRQSKVLMLGFNGVASEVAKILTLAGIDTLTIVDDKPFQEDDLYSNLFCRPSNDKRADTDHPFRTHAVSTKLKRLNPLVKVCTIERALESIEPDEYKNYDLVTLHTLLSVEETAKINALCRRCDAKFFIVLDYGFYGFIFNDLGESFNFTHEDYLKQDEIQKNKDVSVIGGNGAEEDFDIGYGSSDKEEEDDDIDSRPKKRRRIHSPVTKVEKPKDVNEKETTMASLNYVPFKNAISLQNHSFSKTTSPVLLLSIARYRFYDKFGFDISDGNNNSRDHRIELANILEAMAKDLSLPGNVLKNLDDDWIDHIYGSLSPVCAILGGVAGQDMIRALSRRDVPLYNTFSLNGITMNGVVEKLGIVESSNVKPVVRDVLVLSDDDDDE